MKVAILSDIHANIFALQAVIEDLNKESVEKIIVAGDIVGYYYWPREVIELIMADSRFICIHGNHENILRDVLACTKAANRYRRKYGSGYDFCQQQLSKEHLQWLFSLPESICLDIDGMQFHVSHGTLGDLNEYLYPDAPINKLLQNYSECEFTIFGHTHYPFFHSYNNRFLLNPGSVGQPRDQGGLASYIIINSNNRVLRFKRKPFNIEPIIHTAYENDPELGYLTSIMKR